MSTTDAHRAPITSPAVWHAGEVADPAVWTIDLTDDQRNELAEVSRSARAAGRTIATITPNDAPLPTMTDTLRRS